MIWSLALRPLPWDDKLMPVNNGEALGLELHWIAIAFLFTFLSSWIAWKRGFYRYPPSDSSSIASLLFKEVLGGFVVFLLMEVVIMPFAAYFWFSWKAGHFLTTNQITVDPITQGWLGVFTILSGGIGLLFYFLILEPQTLPSIFRQWGFNPKRSAKDLVFGFMTWFISFPLIVLAGQIIMVVMHLFSQVPMEEQIAVKLLKTSMTYPALFITTMVCVTVIVPVMEEVLFRGLLQTWLKQRFGRPTAIVLCSLIFAFFHFSTSQGLNNIELIISLFILSCFLGYIYERQSSIWAPIGLHMFFNVVSVSMIIWQYWTTLT